MLATFRFLLLMPMVQRLMGGQPTLPQETSTVSLKPQPGKLATSGWLLRLTTLESMKDTLHGRWERREAGCVP